MNLVIILIVSLTIAQMMFSMGLRMSFSELLGSVSEHRVLIARTLVSNYLLIPAITILFVMILKIPAELAFALIILGACPAAPYGPPFTAIAKGNLPVATVLMILLAGTSVVIAPLVIHASARLVAGNELFLKFSAGKMIFILFIIQLLPLFGGLAFRQLKPVIAFRIQQPCATISKIMNGSMILVFVILQYKLVAKIDSLQVICIFLLIAFGVIIGWLTGGSGRETRISASVMTGMRNMSLSLGIAGTAFPGSPVVSGVLIYSLLGGLLLLMYSFLLRWFSPSST